ncbi:MAG: type II secretion system protein GspE [SAR324 cluster bacterium]|uniref:protein-secreting ATPase n=1 Tax=SAR324 cluster bacterium TaxID=2024889 RepID=A0A2A4STP6_9DELT|nr:MAG: type II secretion system protein GspE [SAR324 cluster bacterium]
MNTSSSLNLHQRLIEVLVQKGVSTKKDLEEQWETAISKDVSFRKQLIKSKIIRDLPYQKTVGSLLDLTVVERVGTLAADFQKKFTTQIPIRFAKQYLFYPTSFSKDELILAVVSPWPSIPYEEAARELGQTFSLVLATEQEILDGINRAYDRSTGSAEEAAEILEEDEELKLISELSGEETEDLLDSEDEEPIKRLMNSILFQSVKDESSDIHIDPGSHETNVRYRIDGVLHLVTQVPRQAHIPLLNRVKVMSGLDISMKNQPQDGRTMILLAGKKIDIRVSIIPTVHGEQAVLRLLNQSLGIIELDALGIPPQIANRIKEMIQQPHGIILVTGPTGSGKTTTLYSSLNQLDASQKNIVTIEDPVEYRISDYGQMQVNEKVGVTFAKGLRAMLRQDPDVIMVGEIRDAETAQIAIQASLTGHLVLSTLHTNDAASSVIRLIDMGVEPFLVASTVTAVLAQRLVRKICLHCKESYHPSSEEMDKLALPPEILSNFKGILWRGRGCEQCLHTGYQGRLGVYELLIVNDQVRRQIIRTTDASTLQQVAMEAGMVGLKIDCGEKVIRGITTVEEMLRVVFT